MARRSRGEDVTPERFTFEPLRPEHTPLLASWFATEHVTAWWPPPDPQEDDAADAAGRRFIVVLHVRPIGMIQLCEALIDEDEAEVVGAQPGEVGIDYLIGVPELIGRGVGPAMIATFLDRFVWPREEISGVRVDVAEANRRSWRALEKLGFRRDREGVLLDGHPVPHYVYVHDRSGSRKP